MNIHRLAVNYFKNVFKCILCHTMKFYLQLVGTHSKSSHIFTNSHTNISKSKYKSLNVKLIL